MLYDLHEFQHSMLAPLRLWAETTQQLFANPFSALSYLPESARIAAGSELMARLIRRYDKPAFGFERTTVDGREVAVSEAVALHKPFCNLLHFVRQTGQETPKVLLCAPLSGHYATLLRDTVRALLPDHDVYVTDWIDARQVSLAHGPFRFDDYVSYIQDFIRHLGPEVHVISVCQPTVPVLAAISLLAADDDPCQPRSMTMMGGPIDTRVNPTAVNDYAKKHTRLWFETKVITRVPTKYPGALRRVYPGFLQHAGFVSMNQDRHVDAHLDFYNHLIEGDGDSAEAHRKFYDEYNAVMDLPAEYYLETLERVFLNHYLPEGRLVVHGRTVDPAAVRRTALMTVEGELDDISAPGQTHAAHDLCASLEADQRAHFLCPGVGHYGIFSGRRWREVIYPQVREFIRRHQG